MAKREQNLGAGEDNKKHFDKENDHTLPSLPDIEETDHSNEGAGSDATIAEEIRDLNPLPPLGKLALDALRKNIHKIAVTLFPARG